MKEFGLQIYSVRDKMTDSVSIRSTFKALREMGYSSIQTAGTPAIPYEEYAALAAEAGLKIIGTHEDFDTMVHDFDRALEIHRILGATYMGKGSFKAEPMNDTAAWEHFIEQANAVGKKCAEHGMKFTYHNHSHEFIKLPDGRIIMELLAEKLDPRYTSFVLDTYWVQHGGGDVRAWIEKLSGRIDILHLKDMKRTAHFDEKRGHQMFAEIGQGNLDWERILETAQKSGVKHYIVEQDTCDGDSLDSVRMSAEYLKKFIQ